MTCANKVLPGIHHSYDYDGYLNKKRTTPSRFLCARTAVAPSLPRSEHTDT
jgi:hypothetical protein